MVRPRVIFNYFAVALFIYFVYAIFFKPPTKNKSEIAIVIEEPAKKDNPAVIENELKAMEFLADDTLEEEIQYEMALEAKEMLDRIHATIINRQPDDSEPQTLPESRTSETVISQTIPSIPWQRFPPEESVNSKEKSHMANIQQNVPEMQQNRPQKSMSSQEMMILQQGNRTEPTSTTKPQPNVPPMQPSNVAIPQQTTMLLGTKVILQQGNTTKLTPTVNTQQNVSQMQQNNVSIPQREILQQGYNRAEFIPTPNKQKNGQKMQQNNVIIPTMMTPSQKAFLGQQGNVANRVAAAENNQLQQILPELAENYEEARLNKAQKTVIEVKESPSMMKLVPQQNKTALEKSPNLKSIATQERDANLT